MRIALISAVESVNGEEEGLRATLSVAGRRVARHQLDCALMLGCERIAVYCEAGTQGLPWLRHAAERGGAKYHEVAGLRDLSAFVSAADELLVFADGLLPHPELLRAEFAERRGILTFPENVAVPAGFERIDAELGWAGAMMIRGEAVERTSFLPADSDPVSALLRVALQLGTRLVELPGRELQQGSWYPVANEREAQQNEAEWLRRHASPAPWSTPGRAFTDRLALHQAHRIAELPGGASGLLVAGLALLALVTALGVFGYPAWGLALLAISCAVFASGETAKRMERGGQGKALRPGLVESSFPWLADLALVVLAAIAIAPGKPFHAAFAPLVLVGLFRTASRFGKARWKDAARERVALCAVLALCAALGWLAPAVQLIALGTLLLMLLAKGRG